MSMMQWRTIFLQNKSQIRRKSFNKFTLKNLQFGSFVASISFRSFRLGKSWSQLLHLLLGLLSASFHILPSRWRLLKLSGKICFLGLKRLLGLLQHRLGLTKQDVLATVILSPNMFVVLSLWYHFKISFSSPVNAQINPSNRTVTGTRAQLLLRWLCNFAQSLSSAEWGLPFFHALFLG